MMASCTPVFNKHIYPTVRTPSESQSEISSVDSDWSDLKNIAAQLGVSNVDDLATERFKVDRLKLENMIKTDSDNGDNCNRAEQFFNKIMLETKTQISWPCRLKIGAKTKKDPHVRIVGRPDDVNKAKDRIMSCLDSRGTRVIMKMDVSYTDHSYIIGRGGKNIKRIMDNTQTHIHFPDSNRSNPTEKSNQVSLCGSLEGVEKARALVRASTPLLISFELPIIAPGFPVPDNDTPYVKEIEECFNVQVIFSTRPKLHSSLVLVKGSEKEMLKVKNATQNLINQMCDSVASQINVQMQLEITTQHHPTVLGRGSSNLLDIMRRTGTQIMFPDAHDVNIKPIKRSQVTITGTIDGVYFARQQLIGNLPVTLLFDYPENFVDSDIIARLMQTLDVFINVRQKSRQSTLCIVIRGVEKYIDKIYDARYQLLNLQTPRVKAEIPSTYLSPQDSSYPISALLATQPLSPMSPVSPFPSVVSWAPDFGFSNIRNQMQNMQMSPNPVSAASKFQPKKTLQPNQPKTLMVPPLISPRASNGPNNMTINSSGYQSFANSNASLDQLHLYGTNQATSTSSASILTTDANSNNNTNRSRSTSTECNFQYLNDLETRVLDNHLKNTTSFEYDPIKILAYQAINTQPNRDELRVPNIAWSGLGLSRTSPVLLNENSSPKRPSNWERCALSPYYLGVTTGLMDSASSRQRMNIAQRDDLNTLLANLGLEHYIKTFVVHEIDLGIFSSLTEQDLIGLGVTAFGPRRKLLMAIRDLAFRGNKPSSAISAISVGNSASSQQNTSLNADSLLNGSPSTMPKFSGSAAPGAERRTSSGW